MLISWFMVVDELIGRLVEAHLSSGLWRFCKFCGDVNRLMA